MSGSLNPLPRAPQIGVRPGIKAVIELATSLALFTSAVWLVTTRGPLHSDDDGGFLGTYLRLAVPLFR